MSKKVTKFNIAVVGKQIEVWAISGLYTLFREIEGVTRVSYSTNDPEHYRVYVEDPRYNTEHVAEEIRLILLRLDRYEPENDGKNYDVCIEETMGSNSITNTVFIAYLTVWADAGLKTVIENVPGVIAVNAGAKATKYTVYFDHRYDLTVLKYNIEQAIRFVQL